MDNFSIVPPHLAVKAMRDNGYKNAAYALAELMDNSVQAGAKMIELMVAEKDIQVGNRKSKYINQIALLDDASGMDADTLRMALQFGNGTRLSPDKHTGIGKFGMGLPSSSISQCKRVDVWSWQDGVENAYHCFLDIKQIQDRSMVEVPEPQLASLPANWLTLAKNIGKTGTFVLWSDLDRLQWRRASTVVKNTEFVIGRMYRRFLANEKLKIRMLAFDADKPKAETVEKFVESNDPGYLMPNTSTPAPWNEVPMFEEYGDPQVFKIFWGGEKHEVKLTCSIAKLEARPERNSGSLPHGKHAARNAGLSVVRTDRELELFLGFTDPSSPRDRWWGIEIDFPASLDELFGVTNNKQNAHRLNEVLTTDLDELMIVEGVKTVAELKDSFEIFNDPRGPLLELCNAARNARGYMRTRLKDEGSNKSNSRKRYDRNSPAAIATQRTRTRQKSGHIGKSDLQENEPRAVRLDGLAQGYVAAGYTAEDATQEATKTLDSGQKYTIVHKGLSGPAFFDVAPKGGALMITLNSNHPAYRNLLEVGRIDLENIKEEELRERLSRTVDGLELLIYAWARYEDENQGPRLEAAQDARTDWGRHARDFLRAFDE